MVRVRDIHYTTLILETDSRDKAYKFIDKEGYAVIKEDVTIAGDFVIWVS